MYVNFPKSQNYIASRHSQMSATVKSFAFYYQPPFEWIHILKIPFNGGG